MWFDSWALARAFTFYSLPLSFTLCHPERSEAKPNAVEGPAPAEIAAILANIFTTNSKASRPETLEELGTNPSEIGSRHRRLL